MSTDQEREFELVLGNKQLFSVLFIVIVLLAVFFAMGYVMGRNTGAVELAKRPAETATSPYADSGGGKRSAASGQMSAPVSQPVNTPAAENPQTQTAAAPAQTAQETAAPASTPAPASKPLEVSPVASVTDPQPGQTFWQVSAVAKPEAELLVEVLTKKGFHSIIAPGPNEKLFRVLVGPARDQSDLGRLRSELEQAGFKPMLRKY